MSATIRSRPSDLSALINQVHPLTRVSSGQVDTSAEPLAGDFGQEVDYAGSHRLPEDGKKFKSLKRHLRTQYSMTPSNTARNGRCPRIIRWWRRITPLPARNSPADGARPAAPAP
jgi:hypothetical protein